MALRVPDSALRDSALNNMVRGEARIAKLNAQISSGKRVLGAEDDAVAYTRIKDLRGVLVATEQYQSNISRVEDQVAVAESTMGLMENLLARGKELAIAMSNGSLDATQRLNMAAEAEHLLGEMVTLANTQTDGRYIFAGYRTGTEPFDATGAYSGDSGVRKVEVSDGVTVAGNTPGDRLMNGAGGGVDVFQSLIQLRDGLQTNDTVAINASIDNIDAASEQITRERMIAGLQLGKLETRRDSLDEITFQTQRLLSENEDLDLAGAISELTMQQSTLELTRSALGRILSSQSLLNFLR